MDAAVTRLERIDGACLGIIDEPYGGMKRVRRANTDEVGGHRRRNFNPVRASVGGAQNDARCADDPAYFWRKREPGNEVRADAARLR